MECHAKVIEKQLRHCCDELERRLRCGEASRAEEFFDACPELTEDAETALDLIYREFVVRSELGTPPTADEYYERFPQWREPLSHQFQVHRLLGDDVPQRTTDPEEPTPWPRDMTPPRPWKNNPPDFEVLEEISRGSMGVVYRAWQKSVRRVVALKIVLARALSSPDDLARFRQEAEATGRLVHPNIVQIFRIDEWEHCPFLVLEHVEGHTLADHWTGGPQPANDTAALVLTLANAVQFAHERGVVHRDLRSGNVLLTKEGAPKIIDFGLAKLMLADDQLTFPGQVLGTPSYMAPEQAAGRNSDVGPAVDLYALGAILYEGMTGRPPFRGETILDTLQQVIEREPVPPRSLQPRAPRDLETICLKCLQKTPERRYASAAELAEDLRRFLAGEPIHARRVHAFERLWRWCARNPAIANLLLALFAALVIGFSLVVWKWRQELQARIDADNAQQDAQREQLIARTEKIKAERLSAGIVFEQAIRVGDHGNIDHAMLLLGQCLEQAAANEDAALDRAARISLTALRGFLSRRRAAIWHPDWVWTIAYSPDGKQFATGSKDKSVRIFDTASGQPIGKQLEHEAPVWSVAYSPDGQTLATGSGDPKRGVGTVRLWSIATGQALGPPLIDAKAIRTVAFTADGAALLVLDIEKAQLWSPAERKPLGPPLAHPGGVMTAVLSPDGKRVLTGGTDGAARLWHVPSGESAGGPLRHDKDGPQGPNHQTRIVAAAFSPDGQYVVTASQVVDLKNKRYVGGAARLWRVANQEPAVSPMIHNGPLKTAVFSPDGRRLLTGSFQQVANEPEVFRDEARTEVLRGEARLWDVALGLPIGAPLEHGGPVWAVDFSPNGRVAISCGEEGHVRYWLTATGQRVANFYAQGNARALGVALDGRTMVVGHTDTPALAELWEMPPGCGELLPTRHEKGIHALSYSSDGKFLFVLGGDGVARICDCRTGQPRGSPLNHKGSKRALGVSPDGKFVLTAPTSRQLQLWDSASAKAHGRALVHRDDVTDALFSADGKNLFSLDGKGIYQWDVASGKSTQFEVNLGEGNRQLLLSGNVACVAVVHGRQVRLWDLQRGRELYPPLEHKNTVTTVAASPQGRWIATATDADVAQLWNAVTGAPHGKPMAHSSSWIKGLTFSPDDQLLSICRPDSCRIWDTSTVQAAVPALLHSADINGTQFTPDRRTLLVASGDAILLWDVTTGKRLGLPLRHPKMVTHVAIHPDGNRFVTACADGMLRAWDLPTAARGEANHLVDWIEVLTGRKLSDSGALEEIDAAKLVERRAALERRGPEPFHP